MVNIKLKSLEEFLAEKTSNSNSILKPVLIKVLKEAKKLKLEEDISEYILVPIYYWLNTKKIRYTQDNKKYYIPNTISYDVNKYGANISYEDAVKVETVAKKYLKDVNFIDDKYSEDEEMELFDSVYNVLK